MLRRIALLAATLAASAAATVGIGGPAHAVAGVTASHVTSPSNGAHFMVTDANNASNPTFTVTGTSNGTTGDHVDIRCYTNQYSFNSGPANVPVAADGTFTANADFSTAYGRCNLRAVPSGWTPGADLRAFTGPKITTEWNISKKVSGGPHDGKLYDFYVELQSAGAMNDYCSTSCGGLWDSRLSYSDGSSSNYLWYGNAVLPASDTGIATRASLQIDGHNAYLPRAAAGLFANSQNLPGWVGLTYTASRNAKTGVTTIRSVEPAVRCSSDTFPATSSSCTSLLSTGVRLERTIVADDGGRRVRVSDTWRSTNGHSHTVSARYLQTIQGRDPAPPTTDTAVGLKLPWLSSAYSTSTADKQYAGPSRVPGSLFVRDDNTAPDGSLDYVRGALSFDVAPSKVHRNAGSLFSLNDDAIKVPAGGSRLVRQVFVMGTTESQVAAKAAAARAAINPYRPDGSVKTAAAGHYTGGGAYGTTGAGQSVLVKTTRGRTATFDLRLQNHGSAVDSVILTGPGSGAGFAVSYRTGTSGGQDVTAAVTHGTYRIANLAPGQYRVLRLIVTVKSGAALGTHAWLVRLRSAHDGTRRDAVRANVKVTG